MSDQIKKVAITIAALVALALGGAAYAAATNDNGGNDTADQEAAEGPEQGEGAEGAEGDENEGADEQGDPSEEVDAATEARAQAAAEKATGGNATEVATEEADGTAGPQDDDNEASAPAGSAYEVEVDKASREIKVYLDSDFAVLGTHTDDQDE
jgi:uncharacterized membrane protein YkoI